MESGVARADLLSEVPLSLSRPRLTPALHGDIKAFLSQPDRVFDLVKAMGSPVNIMFPENVRETIGYFNSLYKKQKLTGRVYFSCKPNKSHAVIRQAAMEDVGVDVSSVDQLRHALAAGFAPARLSCTGPKNPDYLALAIQQDLMIVADNFSELAQIECAHRVLGKKSKVRIMVRISNLRTATYNPSKNDNTFGINSKEVPRIIELLLEKRDCYDLVGFAFHLSGVSDDARLAGIEGVLKATIAAFDAGLRPRAVNIGGGYRVNYVEHESEWNNYVTALKESVLGKRESMSWNDSGLGLRNDGGILKGAPSFIDHYEKHDRSAHLCNILERPLAGLNGMTTSEFLRDLMLDLYIEPGRAVLDQTGITIAKVNFRKHSEQGETLIGLDINNTNLNSSRLKLMTDPIILHRPGQKRTPADQGVFYFGNLCLSFDIITYHKTYPEFYPEPGDLVVFGNTAAYHMDFSESEALRHPLARKVAVRRRGDEFEWFADDVYNPAALAIEEAFSNDR